MVVAQIGLGKFGLLRSWAWHDIGVRELIVFDPSPPPNHRLPPGAVMAKSLKQALAPADIVMVSVPPKYALEVLSKAAPSQEVYVEKPGGLSKDQYLAATDLLPHLQMAYCTYADRCVQRVVSEVKHYDSFQFRSARLHQTNLHDGITVIEDLSWHDLVICLHLGLFEQAWTAEVSGEGPTEAHIEIKNTLWDRKAVIDSSTRNAGRVRKLAFEGTAPTDLRRVSWEVNPDQYAMSSEGAYIPPSQARPMYVECSDIYGGMLTYGFPDEVLSLWSIVNALHDSWK